MSSGYSFMIIGLSCLRRHGYPAQAGLLAARASTSHRCSDDGIRRRGDTCQVVDHTLVTAFNAETCGASGSALRHLRRRGSTAFPERLAAWTHCDQLAVDQSLYRVPTVLSVVVYREPLSLRKSLTLLLVAASLHSFVVGSTQSARWRRSTEAYRHGGGRITCGSV